MLIFIVFWCRWLLMPLFRHWCWFLLLIYLPMRFSCQLFTLFRHVTLIFSPWWCRFSLIFSITPPDWWFLLYFFHFLSRWWFCHADAAMPPYYCFIAADADAAATTLFAAIDCCFLLWLFSLSRRFHCWCWLISFCRFSLFFAFMPLSHMISPPFLSSFSPLLLIFFALLSSLFWLLLMAFAIFSFFSFLLLMPFFRYFRHDADAATPWHILRALMLSIFFFFLFIDFLFIIALLPRFHFAFFAFFFHWCLLFFLSPLIFAFFDFFVAWYLLMLIIFIISMPPFQLRRHAFFFRFLLSPLFAVADAFSIRFSLFFSFADISFFAMISMLMFSLFSLFSCHWCCLLIFFFSPLAPCFRWFSLSFFAAIIWYFSFFRLFLRFIRHFRYFHYCCHCWLLMLPLCWLLSFIFADAYFRWWYAAFAAFRYFDIAVLLFFFSMLSPWCCCHIAAIISFFAILLLLSPLISLISMPLSLISFFLCLDIADIDYFRH